MCLVNKEEKKKKKRKEKKKRAESTENKKSQEKTSERSLKTLSTQKYVFSFLLGNIFSQQNHTIRKPYMDGFISS